MFEMKKTFVVALVILALFIAMPAVYAQNGNETEPIIPAEPVSTDLVAGIVFIMWFLGIVAKAMVPYYRKMKTGEIKDFDVRYLWVFVINVVICLGQAVRNFGSEFPILPEICDMPTLAIISVAAFVVGAGLTWAFDEIFKWFQFIKPEQETAKQP